MDARPHTVLLVEDEADIREALEEHLEEMGLEVIPAVTGKQALDFLLTANDPPDLVLLDLLLPLVSGWQVLERIRSDSRLAAVPVVVMTALNSDRPPGASAVLQKPFGLSSLEETLRRFQAV